MTTPVQQAIEALRAEFGTRLSTTVAVREQHGRGEAFVQGFPPDAVIWPENTGEVSTIVRTCHALRVPVIAYGAGTSLEGHVSAPRGGICIDMSRMDQVLAVHADDADCVVQPGSRAKHSTLSCATPECSSPSIPARMRRSAA